MPVPPRAANRRFPSRCCCSPDARSRPRRGRTPHVARACVAVAAGAFRRIDAQPLQMNARFRHAESTHGMSRSARVCTNTPSACRSSQRRCGAVYCRRVRSCGSVGSPRCRNGVRKNGTPRRRASRSPHTIGNEYGNAVAWTASSGPSYRPASRHIAGQIGLHGVVRHCQRRHGKERERFEDVAPGREVQGGVAANREDLTPRPPSPMTGCAGD